MTITYKNREYTVTSTQDVSHLKNLTAHLAECGFKPVVYLAKGKRGAQKEFIESFSGKFDEFI